MRIEDDAIEVVVTRLPVELRYGAHGKPALARRLAISAHPAKAR